MARRRRSRSAAFRAAELALAVPQVIARRAALTQDSAEMTRMVTEKQAAFLESWGAMAARAMAANQALALSMMQSVWLPPGRRRRATNAAAARYRRAARGVLAAGLAPVHRTATANARRLRRAKRG